MKVGDKITLPNGEQVTVLEVERYDTRSSFSNAGCGDRIRGMKERYVYRYLEMPSTPGGLPISPVKLSVTEDEIL